MSNVDRFEQFAAAFEATVEDDKWSRLEPYLAENVTYVNVGGPDPECEGRRAVIAFLQADVSNIDRKFDTRKLVALTPPSAKGDRLSRRWRITYTLAGAPDLILEGEARYLFEGDLIKGIEEELTPASMQEMRAWMARYGTRLQA